MPARLTQIARSVAKAAPRIAVYVVAAALMRWAMSGPDAIEADDFWTGV